MLEKYTKIKEEKFFSLQNESFTPTTTKYQCFTITDDTFDHFIKTCNQAKAPNKVLREALAFTRQSGIR